MDDESLSVWFPWVASFVYSPTCLIPLHAAPEVCFSGFGGPVLCSQTVMGGGVDSQGSIGRLISYPWVALLSSGLVLHFCCEDF